MDGKIPMNALQRLPMYLHVLKDHRRAGRTHTSSSAVAAQLGLTEIQVRKDLALVSKAGRPKVGYVLEELIADIEKALGCDNIHDAVLIGAGRLGRALMEYSGFREYGVNIVAGFDEDERCCTTGGEKPVYPMERLQRFCARRKIRLGIITVPAQQAQDVCDRLVEAGVTAIGNFAPVHLCTPEHILVKNEDMAASLAVLSYHLTAKL